MSEWFECIAIALCTLPFFADVFIQLKAKKGFIMPVFGAAYALGFFFGAAAHATGRGAGVPLVFYVIGAVAAFWSFVLKAEKSEEEKEKKLYGEENAEKTVEKSDEKTGDDSRKGGRAA